MNIFIKRAVIFSPCRVYRYTLSISWDDAGLTCNFIMLNPSTADEISNDPTVERCERRAREWGYGRLMVTNLFALRATDPGDMLAADDPVGADNDHHILSEAKKAAIVICGWGNHGNHRGRSGAVVEMLRGHGIPLSSLRQCKNGEPQHPLYLSYSLKPVYFWKEGSRS